MNSKTFCILPWVHIYANPDGSVLPCCVADHHLHLGNTRNNSIKEIWNNQNYKTLRKKMLAGEQCGECTACYHSENNNNTSPRLSNNEKFKDYMHLVDQTNDDGSLEDMNLVYFDVRWSNICNFKCRSCSGTYSSSWAIEDNKNGRKRDVYIFAGGDNNDKLYDQFVPHFKDMKEIYFAGGEPLLTDKHYEMLDYLIENNLTDIYLRYNTNFSTLTFKGKSIFDYWKHFKKIDVYISLDSWGDRAEYIREGTNWAEIKENVFKTKQQVPHVNLQSHTVISCFNVFTFTDFLDYLFENEWFSCENYFPTIYNLINPYNYSYQIFDDEMKDKIIKKLRSKNYNEYINQQISAIIYALENSTYNPNLRKSFIDATQYYDKLRNKNFLETFPELNKLNYL
jgi:radical SAM protein with 4Fe4S-binding SPASM domain